MKKITVICDRCKQSIDGLIDEDKFTGGFYDVSEGYWHQFAYLNEKIVCDNCMHTDANYHRTYNIGNE